MREPPPSPRPGDTGVLPPALNPWKTVLKWFVSPVRLRHTAANDLSLSVSRVVILPYNAPYNVHACLGGAVVRRRTRDRKVAGSTPGRGAIKSTRSTQPSIPPGYR